MPHRVSFEAKAEAMREGLHRGRGAGVLTSTLGNDDGTIVDHTPPRTSPEVLKRVGEEDAALETGSAVEDLRIQKAAVTEN